MILLEQCRMEALSDSSNPLLESYRFLIRFPYSSHSSRDYDLLCDSHAEYQQWLHQLCHANLTRLRYSMQILWNWQQDALQLLEGTEEANQLHAKGNEMHQQFQSVFHWLKNSFELQSTPMPSPPSSPPLPPPATHAVTTIHPEHPSLDNVFEKIPQPPSHYDMLCSCRLEPILVDFMRHLAPSFSKRTGMLASAIAGKTVGGQPEGAEMILILYQRRIYRHAPSPSTIESSNLNWWWEEVARTEIAEVKVCEMAIELIVWIS